MPAILGRGEHLDAAVLAEHPALMLDQVCLRSLGAAASAFHVMPSLFCPSASAMTFTAFGLRP